MDKQKIVKELNGWVKKEFGSLYCVKYDSDLMLYEKEACVAWFVDFKKNTFLFANSNASSSIHLIKKGIIEKFYDKAIELLSKCESKYTIQVFPHDRGYLRLAHGAFDDDTYYDIDSSEDKYHLIQTNFTQSEIEKLKKRDDIAIDWDKAVIKEVDDNE